MVRKVIINTCFGGYGWSQRGVLEILKLKGIKDLHFYVMPLNRNDFTEVSEQEFISESKCSAYYLWEIGVGGTEKVWTRYNIDREDPEAIAVLERFGSDFCSSSCARLRVEEFDDEFYDFRIDEYDGAENLETFPRLTREQVLRCKTVKEVADILQKIGVIKEEVPNAE